MEVSNPTVLIVDGSAQMRFIIKNIFLENYRSCDILEAEDGIDAVKKFKAHQPDLVTMGVDLPLSSGIIALNAIMEIDPTAKVIMVSAKLQKNLEEDVIKLGAIGYITKPFERNVITTILMRELRKAMSEKAS